MFIAKNYETDNGIILPYSVAVYISYNKEYKQQTEKESFLPDFLLSELQWFSRPCPTKQVTARYVVITLVSGDIIEIGCPFRPGTTKWFAFWKQLESPEIVSIKGFGEKVAGNFLKSLLGVT